MACARCLFSTVHYINALAIKTMAITIFNNCNEFTVQEAWKYDSKLPTWTKLFDKGMGSRFILLCFSFFCLLKPRKLSTIYWKSLLFNYCSLLNIFFFSAYLVISKYRGCFFIFSLWKYMMTHGESNVSPYDFNVILSIFWITCFM